LHKVSVTTLNQSLPAQAMFARVFLQMETFSHVNNFVLNVFLEKMVFEI